MSARRVDTAEVLDAYRVWAAASRLPSPLVRVDIDSMLAALNRMERQSRDLGVNVQRRRR